VHDLDTRKRVETKLKIQRLYSVDSISSDQGFARGPKSLKSQGKMAHWAELLCAIMWRKIGVFAYASGTSAVD
jgi:hypothetical protein